MVCHMKENTRINNLTKQVWESLNGKSQKHVLQKSYSKKKPVAHLRKVQTCQAVCTVFACTPRFDQIGIYFTSLRLNAITNVNEIATLVYLQCF